jgi:hypothetical protein
MPMVDDLDNWVVEVITERNRKLKTRKLLKYCKKAGITRLALGMDHPSVPYSCKYPWMLRSAVQYPTEARYDGWGSVGIREHIWPAIWWAVKQAGIYSGCGNNAQAQIDIGQITVGIYHLNKDTGHWKKVA